MEQLIGENITVLPFKGLTKVSDLLFFDGPVLSHFKDEYGKDILFYWVDINDSFTRWLVFQISENQLYNYLLKHFSLRDVIQSPVNDIFYSIEIGDLLEYKNIVQIFKEDINDNYIPEEESYFESEIPSIYNRKLEEYDESFVIESFLKQAMYLKAEPKKEKKSKNHGLVGLLNAADFLYGYGESYKGLMAYQVRKEFQNRGIVDEKRVRKSIKQVADASLLNLVKSKAASFAIALSPNNITGVDEQFLGKEWRDNVFQIFKKDVIEIDKKSWEEIDQIVQGYGEDDISEIYKPIIELYNNKDIEINITDENFIPKRTVTPIKQEVVVKLIKPKNEAPEEPVDRLALVKLNPKTGKITGTSQATLFDQSIQTSWSTDNIKTEKRNYKLRHKLYADYRIENSLHIIEMNDLGIYATGESVIEAELNFYNVFHNLYEHLISIENKDLSFEEIEQKNVLTYYVR